MAAKTSWHRYGTKVRYRHPMYYRWCRRPGVLTHPINQQSPWQRRTCVTWPRSLPVTWPPRRRRHWRRSGAVPRGAGDGVLFHGVLSVCLSVVAGRTGRCDVTRELRRRRLRSLPTPSLTTTTIVRRLRRRRRRRRRQTGRQTDISRRKTLTLFHIFDIYILHTEKTESRPQRSLMVVDATENWLIMIRQSINQYSFITAWQNAGQHDGAFWPDLITVIGVKCLNVFYLPQQDWY